MHCVCRFKYNPELVKKLLEKKRAAGKMTGSAAQVREGVMLRVLFAAAVLHAA